MQPPANNNGLRAMRFERCACWSVPIAAAGAPRRSPRVTGAARAAGQPTLQEARRGTPSIEGATKVAQKIAQQPLNALRTRAPQEDTAAQIAVDAAIDALRAPERAIVKQGGAGGVRLRRTKQQVEHPAVEVVRSRMRDESAPGRRRDGHKVGLVVEGGGMRGVVTGAALQAMHDLGMRSAFDAVYGSSAGAINATYFLSGQRNGVGIYTEHIANQRFIDLNRLWKRGDAPVLDLDFLMAIIRHRVPLDWEAVLASDVPLKVVASCLDTLQPIILQDFTSAHDLETCLRASANVPEVAGRPILHRGRRLVDAAVFEPVPFRTAIADGCTHIITLCSRPPFQGGRVAKLVDGLVSDLVKRLVLNPEYMRAAWMREVENSLVFGMTTDEMLVAGLAPGSHRLPHFAGTHCYPLFPGNAAQAINPLCTDVPLLEAGWEEGRSMILSLFAPSAIPHCSATTNALQPDGTPALAQAA